MLWATNSRRKKKKGKQLMFSKKLNFDIIEKGPNTYYVVKDPDQPPYAITVTRRDAIEYILPYADAYLNGELGLIKDPIGRHDSHNDYYSYVSYDGTWYRLHKLIKGELKELRHATLDGLINKIEDPSDALNKWVNYCPNDMTITHQTRQPAEILANCTYPVFLTDDEDRIDELTAEQQEYLEDKTNYDLSIDMTETDDGYSFEPIINGELLDKNNLKALVTDDQLTEINYHFKQVKKAILDSLKDIPTK
jgi:hypothetical protein